MLLLPISAYRRRRVRQLLLAWASGNLRDYPWRKLGIGTYEVVVAEVLLKRTTSTAVARIYGPFLKQYPVLSQLVLASEDELAHTLAPLGLSRQRAKALRKLALTLEERGGHVPRTLSELRALPGLGDYAARAIMSFGYGDPVAVVDGNVERVVGRVFLRSVGAGAPRPTVQAVADALLPRMRHRDFNFALLDLGALICRPARPRCVECPLKGICDYARRPVDDRTSTPLRTARLSKGVSLSRLAALAGVSKMTVINIEAGRTSPRPETVRKLAMALSVSPEELA